MVSSRRTPKGVIQPRRICLAPVARNDRSPSIRANFTLPRDPISKSQSSCSIGCAPVSFPTGPMTRKSPIRAENGCRANGRAVHRRTTPRDLRKGPIPEQAPRPTMPRRVNDRRDCAGDGRSPGSCRPTRLPVRRSACERVRRGSGAGAPESSGGFSAVSANDSCSSTSLDHKCRPVGQHFVLNGRNGWKAAIQAVLPARGKADARPLP